MNKSQLDEKFNRMFPCHQIEELLTIVKPTKIVLAKELATLVPNIVKV